MAKVLIVDDAMFMRAMLKKILEENGHTIIGEASNGTEAVNTYQLLSPEIVTMDITMPDMNGIEAVKTITSVDPNARIIMCSAVGHHHMVLEAIKSGAKDFIVKPFQPDRVIEAFKRVLSCNYTKSL